jgi:uncharacterized membrane protein YccC
LLLKSLEHLALRLAVAEMTMNRKLAVGLGAAGLGGLGGLLAGMDWLEVLCAAALAAALAGVVFFLVRRRRAKASGPYCEVKE